MATKQIKTNYMFFFKFAKYLFKYSIVGHIANFEKEWSFRNPIHSTVVLNAVLLALLIFMFFYSVNTNFKKIIPKCTFFVLLVLRIRSMEVIHKRLYCTEGQLFFHPRGSTSAKFQYYRITEQRTRLERGDLFLPGSSMGVLWIVLFFQQLTSPPLLPATLGGGGGPCAL
jgi:hypothetical protein